MPTFAAALKSEISRIARKESRALSTPLHRASTQYRRDVAALKRQVSRLTKQVAFLEGQERGRVAKPAVVADSNAKARFSPLWLKKHRAKLDLSAEQYAQLAGALLDRLTHHVHVVEIQGDSYRLKDSLKKREGKTKSE